MIFLIFIPIFSALSIYLIKRTKYNKFSLLINLSEIFFIFKLITSVQKNGVITKYIGAWGNEVGIPLKVDLFDSVLLMVSAFFWIIFIIYSLYKKEDDHKYYFFINFLRGTFYALILSNDLFNIFILLELIAMLSAILIVYKKDGYAIRSSIYFLLFNSLGMIFYLMGIIIIYILIGTLNIDMLNNLEYNMLSRIAISLIFVSLGIKSAFFPINNWLPEAHTSAPTTISALLSSILVKSGFIVLLKIFSVIPMTEYYWIFTIVGLLTGVTGVIFAISQTDVKLILAYNTIAQGGLILVGIAGDGILKASGMLHIVNNAFANAILFIAIGIITEKYNSRDVLKVKNVMNRIPFAGIVLLLGLASITAMPLTNGFVLRHIIFDYYKENFIITSVIHFIYLGTMISSFSLVRMLFGKTKKIKYKLVISHKVIVVVVIIASIIFQFVEQKYLTYEMDMKIGLQIFELINYFIYVIGGVIFYKLINLKENKILSKIRSINIDFRTSSLIFVVFTIIVIMWR